MLKKICELKEIPDGELKFFEVEGKEVLLCMYEGKVYAVSRRCSHMNAPLEMGSLKGKILTCPMHGAQFDVTTGKKMKDPVEGFSLPKDLPESFVKMMERTSMLIAHVKTYDLETYRVEISGQSVMVDL